MGANVMLLDLYTLCYASVEVNMHDNLKEKNGGRGDIYMCELLSPLFFLIYIDIIDLYYMLL